MWKQSCEFLARHAPQDSLVIILIVRRNQSKRKINKSEKKIRGSHLPVRRHVEDGRSRSDRTNEN